MSEFLDKGAKRALNLIQNKLGIYPLKEWSREILGRHFHGTYGIYILENIINNKLLIGEGNIGDRIGRHFIGKCNNSIFKTDLNNGNQFRMIGYIPCDDIQERKELEFYLHKYYKTSYNFARPPKHLIIRLYEEGKTKKEIQQILDCGPGCVDNNIKLKKTSDKLTSFDKKCGAWKAKYEPRDIKGNKINYFLGYYKSEKEAAENRDYFIIHKGFLDKSRLNYYDVDYNKFKPHLTRNGEMNQHIKEIYENQNKKRNSTRNINSNRTNL